MPITLINIFVCLTSLITGSVAWATEPTNFMSRGTVTLTNDAIVEVEIASTPQQRELGMMHRAVLREDQGMLFIFPNQARQSLWMKNTLLALDVLFLSEEAKVLEILRNLKPCNQETCPIYTSNSKAKYMLEVNAGLADKQGIEPGQELVLEYTHRK